jgi:hypothetical protein
MRFLNRVELHCMQDGLVISVLLRSGFSKNYPSSSACASRTANLSVMHSSYKFLLAPHTSSRRPFPFPFHLLSGRSVYVYVNSGCSSASVVKAAQSSRLCRRSHLPRLPDDGRDHHPYCVYIREKQNIHSFIPWLVRTFIPWSDGREQERGS